MAPAARTSRKRKAPPTVEPDERQTQKAFFKNAATWDLEHNYESKAAKKAKKKERETNTRLPIRRGETVQQAPHDNLIVESDEEWLEGGDQESGEEAEEEEPEEEVPDIPEHQQIREAKEELAKIAGALNEVPEENAGAFKALAKIGQSRIPTIQKIALATQLAVYKDVIPGYRIRPQSEDGPQEKLSKDVRSLRTYEQSLVLGYQNYIKELARHAKSKGQPQDGKKPARGQTLSSIAITCACTLLTSVPHFNFRNEVVKILVGKISTRRVDDDFNKCLRALETFFQDDEEGRPSMEAVSLLSKMIKARNYMVDESVINLFLYLRVLSEFSGKGSAYSVEHGEDGPKKKFKKEFRTKRLRKEMKEQKALEKDMANADALVSHEERDRMQSETLKLVFASYFRILKQRTPHLMGAVLEGLAKYSHLINQDFFGDLLEALKDLIRYSDALADAENDDEADSDKDSDDVDAIESAVRNPSREALLCTVTAFALLAGQDAHNARSDLHLDLSFFTTHLYQTLYPLSLNADLELGAKSLHLPDPDAPQSSRDSQARTKNRVNLQTTTVLLIRCLTAVLLPSWHIRSVPPLRLAAFTKQLMTTALHTPEKSTQAILALLTDVGGSHGRKIASLWNTEERKGDGTFNPMSDSAEGSNPYAATVWEGEILRRHYCPKVREGVKLVEKSLVQK